MPRKAKPKVEKPPPKKRGRKPKKKPENDKPTVPKKRGRKPKGGSESYCALCRSCYNSHFYNGLEVV